MASGLTLRNIIDAVRGAFRVMYAGSTAEDIPNLVNTKVRGSYGVAYHDIGDLVIEELELDQKEGVLSVRIGS